MERQQRNLISLDLCAAIETWLLGLVSVLVVPLFITAWGSAELGNVGGTVKGLGPDIVCWTPPCNLGLVGITCVCPNFVTYAVRLTVTLLLSIAERTERVCLLLNG